MHRITDVNINRAAEALRVIEEVARFVLEDEELTAELKHLRHEIITAFNPQYSRLIESRDTENDIGTEISNPSARKNLLDIHKANFKRLQQALRVLSEINPEKNRKKIGKKSEENPEKNPEFFEKFRYQSYTLEKKMYNNIVNKYKKYSLQSKKLYLVTDRGSFNSENDFLDAVASALKGGVQIIQLREKTATAKEIVSLGKKIRELCSLYEAIFIINDRVDIAQVVNADGVHLGQDDMDIDSARHILGDEAIIGISTHCPEHALNAVKAGADYIGVGPIYTTPTKPGRQAVGLEYAKWAAENIEIPWFAIGGIDTENLKEVRQAGANRIAVVRAIINAKNPEHAAKKFIKGLNINF